MWGTPNHGYSITSMTILTWVRCDHKPGAKDAEKKLRRKDSWEETTERASWRRRYVSRVRNPPQEGKREQCMDRIPLERSTLLRQQIASILGGGGPVPSAWKQRFWQQEG